MSCDNTSTGHTFTSAIDNSSSTLPDLEEASDSSSSEGSPTIPKSFSQPIATRLAGLTTVSSHISESVAMASESEISRILDARNLPKFDGNRDRYNEWKILFDTMVDAAKLRGLLDGTVAIPVAVAGSALSAADKKTISQAAQLKLTMLSSLEGEARALALNSSASGVKVMYEDLQKYQTNLGNSYWVYALADVYTDKKLPDEKMISYFNRTSEKARIMFQARETCTIADKDEALKVACLVNGLDESWDHFMTHTLAAITELSYNRLFEILCAEEARRLQLNSSATNFRAFPAISARATSSPSEEPSMYKAISSDSSSQRTREKYADKQCYSCKQYGHTKNWPKCPKFAETHGGRRSSERTLDNNIRASSRNTNVDVAVPSCHNASMALWSDIGVEDEWGLSVTQNETVFFFLAGAGMWLLDSGASTHICCNKDLLDNVIDKSLPSVKGLGGMSHEVIGYGQITINSGLCLTDVLYSPAAAVNLISVRRLVEDHGFQVIFDKTGATV
ncbi:hypothetical protein SeLEV6574_g08002 [Synchytrium endobioticum]|uniref:Retrovirus-related Pol polyprotein from transposon TNT 1-94-like beta-barrel domain-containing protein n=1 Tax=Synchytrium endobioticum TaxID=286115 RepID=A0A507CCA0_9FUNG|nr:hypothetical protein SeLEV6574_g08002 [Synchytrium endobioticum]